MTNFKKAMYDRRSFMKSAAKGALVTGITLSGLPVLIPGCALGNVAVDNSVLQLLDQYNVKWDSPSTDVSGSMPAGGRDTGLNIWVENGDVLFYMQRSGSLDENGEYLKLGRVRLQLTPNPFDRPTSFRQELKLKEGYVEIAAKGHNEAAPLNVLIKIWVDVFLSAIHVEVEADRDIAVLAAYENWRFENKDLPNERGGVRFGAFSLEGYPGVVTKRKDQVSHVNEGVLFYHRNADDKPIPGVLIKQQGLEASADIIPDDLKHRTFGGLLFGKDFESAGTGNGKYQLNEFRSWKIKSRKETKTHQLFVATHVAQIADLDSWKSTLKQNAANVLKDKKAFSKTKNWWNEYWKRSWIHIHPGNPDPKDPVWQMSRNYQLFRYQLGCNAYGEYPSKFNGGNLTFDPVLVDKKRAFDPDWRAWGGDVFTAQNQRLLYWPMLKAGDYDAITPQFELYRKGLPGATARVKTHFGHEGAAFGEYMNVPGVAFGAGWGWENSPVRGRGPELPFGDPKIDGLAGYDKPSEKGVMANPSVSYHWESQLEHAYMILEYHRFSGEDITQYMPFIKAALVFFDEHYQARQRIRNGQGLDDKGKLVIFPSTSCESYRGATNPSDVLAGLKACLSSLLLLNDKLVSSPDKEYYKGFIERIPDYPFDVNADGLPYIKAAHKWLVEANIELPQFYPLFPFNQFKLGDKEIDLFKNAYAIAPTFRKKVVQSWHQDGIFFARMGMTSDAADFNTKKLEDSPRRFPTFWGPGHDWVPDHNWGGSGMIGLQEMLMQTVGEEIFLLPAWPKEWDVSFRLHAPGQTIVDVEFKNGAFTKVEVTPSSRKQQVRMPV